jgi:hypothetical protein
VISWFQALAFILHLVPLHRGGREVTEFRLACSPAPAKGSMQVRVLSAGLYRLRMQLTHNLKAPGDPTLDLPLDPS